MPVNLRTTPQEMRSQRDVPHGHYWLKRAPWLSRQPTQSDNMIADGYAYTALGDGAFDNSVDSRPGRSVARRGVITQSFLRAIRPQLGTFKADLKQFGLKVDFSRQKSPSSNQDAA